ncbi:hypothetical protein ILUMI_05729 [Ignelater luminosus]|uniref:Uncharacterized protein n=1 Tax=Ignelater luminosus TaxID=2038154 RepID=A0A8K0D762_IGNLU|nr:hypothetical protein ILUMI_05729 [Ignelater luminosus]
MPISEDEYDPRSKYEASSTMSKAELRKTHKPIMEKRRRARINHCLNEIKTLILDAMKKDVSTILRINCKRATKSLIVKPVLQPARHSKLEKADILEMAVKHLQNVQRQQLALAMATDPSVLRKFKAGFNECAEEVKRYISSLDGLDMGVQQRISSHLSKCINGIEQIVHLNFPGFGGVPFLTNSSNLFSSNSLGENSTETPGDQNNNPSIQIPQGLQLIPSRLPTGELALLLPNSSNISYFSSVTSPDQPNQLNQGESHNKTSRSSAFVTVIPSSLNSLIPKAKSPSKPATKLLSPPQSPSSSCSNARQDDDPALLIQNTRNTPSPHGFRPVNPSQPQRLPINSLYHQQAANSSLESQTLVTSTSTSEIDVDPSKRTIIQTEVKTMRFPIQKYSSPQKLAEPLSIITNQSERYRNAQIIEESSHYEENLQRGVKRKSDFSQPGLLAVAPPSSKILKTYHESSVADYRVIKTANVIETPRNIPYSSVNVEEQSVRLETDTPRIETNMRHETPSTSRAKEENNSESNNDMWRPW